MDSTFDTTCRLCGSHKNPTALVAVLDYDEHEQNVEPNILQKIRYCLPVEINAFDAYPKCVCDTCCGRTHSVYEFIETVLTTQKSLTNRLDTRKLIETNKSKATERMSVRLQQQEIVPIQLPPVQRQVPHTPDSGDVDGGGPKQPSSHTAQQMIQKLQKFSTQVTVSKLVKSTLPTMRTIQRQLDEQMQANDPLKLEQIRDDNCTEPSDGLAKVMEQLDNDEQNNTNCSKQNDENHDDDDGGGGVSEEDDFNGENEDDDDDDDDDDDYDDDMDEDYDGDEHDDTAYLDDGLIDDDDPSGDYKPRMAAAKREHTTTTAVRRPDKVTIIKMNSPATYVCIKCKHKFGSFEQLKMHMVSSQRCKEIHLTCETCGKVCATRKSLYQHQVTHRDKFAFVCDKCGKTYTNRFNLENHKSSVHGERVEEFGSVYKCKVCDAQFNNRTDLYGHIKLHAKMPSVHLCDTCGKSYPSLESLRSHIRIHQDIRPFRCTYCDKRFRARLHLIQHQHVHTGIKPFVCDACGRAFAKKGSLVSHGRTHTGDRPYPCTECPQRFASSSKLRTHVRNHGERTLLTDTVGVTVPPDQ